MGIGDGIRRHGFRKWYERELLSSHAWLVLTFLCVVGLFAAFEALAASRDAADRATNLLSIGLCAVVGLWSLRRYLYLLLHAEAAAHQAVCPQCGSYGRLQVVAEDRAASRLRVRCRRCAQEWTIDDP